MSRAKRRQRRAKRKTARKNRRKHVRKLIRKVSGSVKKRVSVTAKKVRQAAKDVKKWGKFALLRPFAGIMKAALKANGLSTHGDIQALSIRFFDNIVKRDNFDEQSLDGRFMQVGEAVKETDVSNLEPATISAIVAAITKYIKKVREKAKKGQPLTKTQDIVVQASDAADEAADDIRNEEIVDAAGETVLDIGEFFRKYWIVILILIAGGVALKRSQD